MRYADIILPFAGPSFYTYGVGAEMDGKIARGSAVAVQFGEGGRKIVGGIVRRLHDTAPSFPTKPVLGALFPEPIVSEGQMRLWEWMAGYYMCSQGEVMLAALPAMLKPSGFSEEEFAADRFRPRTVRMVELGPAVRSEENFNEQCELLRRRAPKQYEALVEIGGRGRPVPISDLGVDASILGALRKKGLVVFSEREADYDSPDFDFRLPELSAAQQTALDELRTALRGGEQTENAPDLSTAKNVPVSPSPALDRRQNRQCLLFGVPSSGKSEICFHAIAGTLARGRDVLLMLPEISLTTQFVERVRRVFGDRVVLYHSALSDRRRAEAYIRLVRSGGGTLVVGTRSSLFLPLPKPGLVVIDEEQDAGYKQQDPAPRYNARDTALVMAGIYNAKVILVSATPSLETWANCIGGRYGLVEITERWGDSPPPEVIVSDTLRAAKRGERRSHFNKELTDRIGRALARGEQVILFQNRRGLAPFIECADCGHVPRCGHCAIPMTVHRGVLRCHYCGATEPLPSLCPACGSTNLSTRGFGTEKIEDELARLFPTARVARLDRDSATSQKAYNRIVGDFEAGATDILVGTQMITKGFDFAGVSLVGILNADNLVNHPDFRASERAYSLIAQVAGRAGRRRQRGEVVIQTAAPNSRLIALAAAGNYRRLAAELMAERAACGYPPSSRLISIMLRHPDRATLQNAAARLASILRGDFGDRLLGPQPPVVEKIKGDFALMFLLKVPRTESMSAVSRMLRTALDTIAADRATRRVTATVNVDPQ